VLARLTPFILAAVVLVACAPATDESSAIQPSPTPSPTETVIATPDPPALEAVDPATFATVLTVGGSQGVDFDSADRRLHCGIFDPYLPDFPDESEVPYVGCVSNDLDFALPDVTWVDGDWPGNGIGVRGDEPAAVVLYTDAGFAGADGESQVRTLTSGQSLSWSSVTCISEGPAVRCTNSASGHGFELSPSAYEVF
jgi:hypothetical protein